MYIIASYIMYISLDIIYFWISILLSYYFCKKKFFIETEAAKSHPKCKDAHESVIANYVARNLIYAYDKVTGRKSKENESNRPDEADEVGHWGGANRIINNWCVN